MKKKGNNFKKRYNSGNSDHSIFKEGKCFQGVLISCQKNQEKFAVRDTYRVLNDNFDIMFGNKDGDTTDPNIESRVLEAIKNDGELQVKTHPIKPKLFNQIKVEAAGLLFVKFDEENFPKNILVKDFVSEIFNKAIETNKIPSK